MRRDIALSWHEWDVYYKAGSDDMVDGWRWDSERRRENTQLWIGNRRAPVIERLLNAPKLAWTLTTLVCERLTLEQALIPLLIARMSTSDGKKAQTQLKNPRGIPQAPFIVSKIGFRFMICGAEVRTL